MKTIEIAPRQWPHLWAHVSERYYGAIITLEFQDANGTARIIVDQQPLRATRFDEQSDACNDILLIEAGASGEKGIQHRIIEPIHIRLKNGEDTRYNQIEVLAENGITFINIHPGFDAAEVGRWADSAAKPG